MTMHKLGKPNDGPPDIMVEKFQEAMSKFKCLEQEVSSIAVPIDHLIQRLSIVSDSHESLWKAFDSFSSFTKLDILKLFNDNEKISHSMQSLDEKCDETRLQISGFRVELASLRVQLQDVVDTLKSFPTTNQIIELSGEIKKIKDSLQFKAEETEFISSEMKERHAALSENNATLREELKAINDKINVFEKRNENQSIVISSLKENINQGLVECNRFAEKSVNEKFNSIPRPEIPSMEEIKKLIESQYEVVRLDASNAKLRSTNNETKVVVLEKKVEQLQLMINKLELKG